MTNTASSTQQTIRISNVCKSYGDYEVLKNVDAEVARLEALGATRVAFVKRWWVMQAPTGHRFCVVRKQRPEFGPHLNTWD